MAPSLPSLDIINPQYSHGSFIDKTNPKINQIIIPSYNSNHERMNECSTWMNTLDQNSYHVNQCGNNSMVGEICESKYSEDSQYVLSYPITSHIDYVQKSLKQERVSQKRKFEGVEMKASKKQCETKWKTKATTSPSKDTQSLAAKNRRERISERLKVLQELVPNGTKVDLVTMLEKAISYVKFLQLQVKVLAIDEFWPAQGGKTPDVSQVKEAIDAILSSGNSEVDNNQNKIEA